MRVLRDLGEHNIGMKADNTKGALAGGSGASLINDMQGTNKVSIGDGSAINASGILVGASDNWDVHAAEGTYAVDSPCLRSLCRYRH